MSDEIFHLKAWTPELKRTAEDLIKRINDAVPELEVLFMGAGALGLPGKNDIDLDILCDVSQLGEFTQKLVPVMGPPKSREDDLVAWEFDLNGFEVDAILSDPRNSHVPLQRRRFEILKANPHLQEEYRQLKLKCDGLPYKEYEAKKIDFFETQVFSDNKQG